MRYDGLSISFPLNNTCFVVSKMIFILHNKQSIYFVYYSFVYTFEVILNKGKK